LGLYETFASITTQGEFFLDSALPSAAIRVDACPSSSSLEEDDMSHLEKVRELVRAAAASLNGASGCPCGPVLVMYCIADGYQRGCLSPEHLDMESLLQLSSLSFVDISRQGCNLVSSLINRMTAAEAASSVVVIDANFILATDAVDNTTLKHTDDDVIRDLDNLISCCLKAISRSCTLKILFVLPQSVCPAEFLQRLPSIANAPADIFTFCQIPVNSRAIVGT
jgi:hypothetical protein